MNGARLPTARTLARYGLTAREWAVILKRQHGGCGVCGQVPPSGMLHIDHEHVRGWRQMLPAQRKQYVRGLLCWLCNVTLRKRVNGPWLSAAAKYLRTYEGKKA